ncbi:MAG: dihydroorotate dehydrogenase electron transfer subunit [Gammaproteobacteria bacterium]|nr:dihydroorotate dehydrogenase electron transfer subunit [Gammaproteobacteria bacterium]MCP5136207.1 dihydroorotate dehydrogenase electron transfer subunit [Gammaproteobacteria bacterium]
MSNESKPHRGTIHVESAKILSHERFPGDQFVLRVAAPECAAKALPGSFVHLRTDPMLRMRRPLSIMRVSATEGWVDMLYKVVGEGTRLLSARQEGETLSMMGPIGKPFVAHPERPRALLLGGGVGIPPMVFLAEHLRRTGGFDPLVLMGSEVPFPFRARPSEIIVPGVPDGVIAAMPLMEDWNIASRLASLQGYPGVFEGYITDLARAWLKALSEEQRTQVEIFACGPHPMLAATAMLAREFSLPCQVSLEEFMACAVGGCAGCVVEVQEDNGPAMRRVCVDGPVFDASRVFV